MAAGKPKGKIHDLMDAVLSLLAKQSTAAAGAVTSDNQPEWFVPSPDDWNGDPLDVKATTKAFNRDEINENYRDAHKDPEDPGTVADATVLKLQIDWIGAMERAYRLRHATSARCGFAAASRLAGHGHEQGTFLGGVKNHLVDILQEGAGPETGTTPQPTGVDHLPGTEEELAAEARGVAFED